MTITRVNIAVVRDMILVAKCFSARWFPFWMRIRKAIAHHSLTRSLRSLPSNKICAKNLARGVEIREMKYNNHCDTPKTPV